MRILQVSTFDLGGGAEKVAWRLHKAFSRFGHKSILAVGRKFSDDPNVVEIDNRVIPLSPEWFKRRASNFIGIQSFGFPGSRRLPEQVPGGWDVAVLHNLHGSYFEPTALPRLVRTAPTILCMHDMWLVTGHCAHPLGNEGWLRGCGRCCERSIYPPIRFDVARGNLRRKERSLREQPIWLASEGRWLLESLKDTHLAGRPTRHTPVPVDLSTFRPMQKDAARAKLGLPSGRFVILFPASLASPHSFKDPRVVIEAASALGEHYPLVVCFGGAPSEAGSVEVQIVSKVDTDEEMALYYGAADVVALASRAETSPVVIPEAWASNRPVVATRLPATEEMIEDGITGFLADLGDARSFASALGRSLDPKVSGPVTERATERAAQHEVGHIARTWLDWFRELTAAD